MFKILYHFLFLIFMPILQVFFSFFSSFNDIQIFEHDLELQYVQKQN